MNPQLPDNMKAPFVVMELDVDGNPVPPTTGDTCTVVPDDLTKATIVFDASPVVPNAVATGFVVAGKNLGTVNITEQITHADATTLPAITDALDIVASAAVTSGFSIGTPIPQ